jgi:hypothetical protein
MASHPSLWPPFTLKLDSNIGTRRIGVEPCTLSPTIDWSPAVTELVSQARQAEILEGWVAADQDVGDSAGRSRDRSSRGESHLVV